MINRAAGELPLIRATASRALRLICTKTKATPAHSERAGVISATTRCWAAACTIQCKRMSLHPPHVVNFILFAVHGTVLFGQSVSFLAPVNTSVGGDFPPSSEVMAVADFNSDGKPDIAVWTMNSQLPFAGSVLFGNGDGTFRSGPVIPGGRPWIGDVNGDDKPDLIISGEGVSIVLSNGDGTFQTPFQVPGCELTAVADFNGDKKADLVCGTTVLLGNGDGSFHTGLAVDAGQFDTVVLAADFNHDGKPDLLLQGLSGQLAVVLGKGDGTFGADLPATTLPGPEFSSVVVGDFDGDGKPDIAGSGTRAGLICVALGNGDGTFGAAIINQGLNGGPMAAADFNGDGKLDLVASGGMVLAGNGDGTFRIPVFIQPGSVAIADFNGDGSPDIANEVAKPNADAIAVLLNDSPGDGFVTAGVSSATLTWPIGPVSIASAFGSNLAPQTATASETSPPTTLGGIRVHVRDSTGDTLAPLLYVSATQINYVMTSSDAFAFIGIERLGSVHAEKGIGVSIGPLEPGFYSVGTGVAAASALSLSANDQETAVPVVSCLILGCYPVPIDVSGNPVYLSLYGTGFHQATAASVACTVAGQKTLVTYAGPQMQVQGLDQLNMLLPRTLVGMGTVSVECFFGSEGVNGFPANVVRIAIR